MLAFALALPPASAAPVRHGGPAEVRASSELASEVPGAYGPTALLDGDLATAWSEGVPGLGVGEWVEIRWEQPVRVEGIAFAPGYAKSADLFTKNASPARLRVELDGAPGPTATVGYRAALDTRGDDPAAPPGTRPMGCYPTAADAADPWRVWLFPEARPVRALRVVIDDVHAGTRWEDTLLSELSVIGPEGPLRAVPPPVYRAIQVLRALRDGATPAHLFAPEIEVASARAGRAERILTASWKGLPPPEPPPTRARLAEAGPTVAAWTAGNREGLIGAPVALRGGDLVGGRTEEFGDGEWIELHPAVRFDEHGRVRTLTEWAHHDGSPGCHHVLPPTP